MNKEYKEFAIRTMYGIIQSTADNVKESVLKRFPIQFGIQPDNVEVIQLNRYYEDETNKRFWVGRMELLLTIEGETYSVYRDWLDEYMVDRRHPNYDSLDFYETEDCYCQKRFNQLMEGIG